MAATDPSKALAPSDQPERWLRITVSGHVDAPAERAILEALANLLAAGHIAGYCIQEPDELLNMLAQLGSDAHDRTPFSPSLIWRDVHIAGARQPLIRRPGTIRFHGGP